MKARDPLRFAEMDQTRFSRASPASRKKRKLGDGTQDSVMTAPDEQTLPISSPSCSSGNEKEPWSSSDDESLRTAPSLLDLPGRLFPASISLPEGRPFPVRSALKPEERGALKPSSVSGGELPRRYPTEKGPVSKSAPARPTSGQVVADGGLVSSSAPRGAPLPSQNRTNKQRGRIRTAYLTLFTSSSIAPAV